MLLLTFLGNEGLGYLATAAATRACRHRQVAVRRAGATAACCLRNSLDFDLGSTRISQLPFNRALMVLIGV